MGVVQISLSLTGLGARVQDLEKQAALLPTKDDANLYSQTLMGQWNVLDDFGLEHVGIINDLVSLYSAVKSTISSHIPVFDAHEDDADAHHEATGHSVQTVDLPVFEAHTGDIHAHHTAVLVTGFAPTSVLPPHTGSNDAHVTPYWYGVFNTGILPVDSVVTALTPVNILYHYPPASWDLNGSKIVFAESGTYKCTYTMVVEKTGASYHNAFTLEINTGYLDQPTTLSEKYANIRTEVDGEGAQASASTTVLFDMRSGSYIELKISSDHSYAGHVTPNGVKMSIFRIGHHYTF